MRGLILTFLSFATLLALVRSQTIDPTNSIVYGPGINGSVAGTIADVYIQARDANNTDITVCNAAIGSWALTLSGAANVNGTIPYCTAGVYSGFYVATVAGAYTLNVTYNGVAAGASPYNIVVNTAPVDAPNCVADGPGLTNAIAGAPAVFYVQTYDDYDNLVTSCAYQADFNVSLTGASSVQGFVTNCTLGNYTITYSAAISGGYTISVLFDDKPIKFSPFTTSVTPGPIDAAQCVAFGTGVSNAVAGQNATFQIQSKDFYGNNIFVCDNDYTKWNVTLVRVLDSYTITGSVNNCVSGVYDATYYTTVSKDYDLYVSFSGTEISGTYLVDVDPAGIDPTKTTAAGIGLTDAQAGIPAQITATPFDQFGNPLDYCESQASWTKWTISLVGTTNNYTGTVYGCTLGIYTLQYTAFIRGQYTLSIAYQNQSIVGSPWSPFVTSGLISPSDTYALGAALTAAQAGVQESFTIYAFDQYNNKIYACDAPALWSRWTISLSRSGNITLGGVTACSEGNYTASYTVTNVGPYVLQVQYMGSSIQGSPFTVVVTAGPPYPANCVATGITNGVVGVQNSYTYTCSDQFFNPISICYTNFTNALTGPVNATIPFTCTAGQYSANYVVYISGFYSLDITYTGLPISGSPFAVIIAAGNVSAANTTAVGPGVTDGVPVAGTQTFFTIEARDQYGNPTLCGPLTDFSVVITDPSGGNVNNTITGCTNGDYNTIYTPIRSGVYTVNITYQGTPINASPYLVTVAAGPIYPAYCTASGVGLTTAIAGQDAYFTISCFDINNNTVNTCLPSANWTEWYIILKGASNVDGNITACSNGVYTATYSTIIAGNYTLDVEYGTTNPIPISGSPFSPIVVAGPIYAPNSYATGQGLIGGRAGDVLTISLFGRDEFNNTITACLTPTDYDDWSLSLTGASTLSGTVNSCANGVYNATYRALVAGSYNLTIEYKGVAIIGSPFNPDITAGPISASQTVATGQGVTSPVDAGDSTFIITSYDDYGNRDFGCAQFSRFSINISGPANTTVVATITSCNQGIYNVSYTATVVGDYNITIEFDSVAIKNSPYPVTVIAGPISPANSVASGPGTIGGYVGDVSEVYILSFDAYGNPVTTCLDPSEWPFWTLDLQGPYDLNATVTNCTNGNYTATYRTVETGNYQLTVSFNGTEISNSPFNVAFTSGIISAANSYATGSGVVGGMAGITLIIDIYTVNEGNITIVTCLPNTTFEVFSTPVLEFTYQGCNQGVYTYIYNASVAQTYALTINYGGEDIKGSPYSVVITPGGLYPPYSIAQGAGVDPVVNGTTTFTITTYDSFRNPITTGGYPVSFIVQPSCVSTTQIFLTDNNDGTYTGSYQVADTGAYCVTLTYANVTIDEAPVYPVSVRSGAACAAECYINGVCFNGECFCHNSFSGATCSEPPPKTGLSDGAFAGIVIAFTVVFFIIGLLIGYFICVRCCKKQPEAEPLLK